MYQNLEFLSGVMLVLFWDNFKAICTDRGTSPTALLEKMGVARNKVSAWGGGSLPKSEMLVRLAKELNCTVMDFFSDDPLASHPQSEDESDILRVFRRLPRRARHEFMNMVYEFESKMEDAP